IFLAGTGTAISLRARTTMGSATPSGGSEETPVEHRTSRQHVVDMCRTMLERGYLKATEGNISVRVPGRRLYAVTPSNYGYERMRVDDICIVDFDGKHVPDDGGTGLAPSIECGMHANVYRERPDVHAIVHTHQ